MLLGIRQRPQYLWLWLLVDRGEEGIDGGFKEERGGGMIEGGGGVDDAFSIRRCC